MGRTDFERLQDMEESEREEDDIEVAAEFVARLNSESFREIQAAAKELRMMTKVDESCRGSIGEAGGIEVLLPLLYSSDSDLQENVITALLNLSINPVVRVRITQTQNALDAILNVLHRGHTAVSKENAAATLFSLLIVEEYRDVVGRHPLATVALLALLREARTHRGKKDALKGLFHLSLHEANKPRLVDQGVVEVLVSNLRDRGSGLVEDSLSVLATLAVCEEGAFAIVRASALPVLVELLRVGSPRTRENSLSVLLALCKGNNQIIRERVAFYNDLIVSVLCSLSVIGSDRAKRKANELLPLLVMSYYPSDSMSSRSSRSASSFPNNVSSRS